MTASQLFRQTESLKKAVSEASFGSNEGWVSRQKLEDLYQNLLVADLEYALDKKVEQDLWNYVFKNQITLMQQQTKDKHSKADVQVGLQLFLETAGGFYLQLLQELCSVYRLDLPFRKRSAFYGIMKEVSETKGMKTPTKASRLYICQYCLVHLGDIARYRQQIDQAQTYYRHAVYLVPYNGQPYNQLAILEASKGHKLASVFYYVRSLLVRNPFPVTAMNLEKFYSKMVREPLELKGKLSMNEIVMAFLQFHGLIYLVQDLLKAEKLKDRLLSSLPAHITSMSFSSQQFIQIIVINIGAMHQATKTKENCSEFDQQRAHQLVMHLNVTLLESLICGTPKQRVREYHTLAGIKILLDWIRCCPGVIEDQTLINSTVWPAMCKLLNNLQYIAQQKTVNMSSSEMEKTPLPEDYDVQCFQPLEGWYRQLDFSSPDPDSLSVETETRLRCERLVHHGVWLSERLPSKIIANKQKNGTYAFTTPIERAEPPKKVKKPVKILLSSQEEYPALERKPRNVAIQSLLKAKEEPVPGSVVILPPQRLSQRSPEQSVSSPQLSTVSQTQAPTESFSAPDLKPAMGILKVPSQDFGQQSGGNGQKPSVHFRIDAREETERESPEAGLVKLPPRQIWMPDEERQAWPIARLEPSFQPRFTGDLPRQLSPTQLAIAKQMTPQDVAKPQVARQPPSQARPRLPVSPIEQQQQLQHQAVRQQQQQQQQQALHQHALQQQQLQQQQQQQQQIQQQKQLHMQQQKLQHQHGFPGQVADSRPQIQPNDPRMAFNRQAPGSLLYQGPDVRSATPQSPIRGQFYRAPQSGKHPLEGLGIHQDWSSDRQFSSFMRAPTWDRVAQHERPNVNLGPFIDTRNPPPFVNLDSRNVTLATQPNVGSANRPPRIEKDQRFMDAPPTPGGAPVTPGASITPSGAPGQVQVGAAPSYSLFASQIPWLTSGNYDVTSNMSSQNTAVAPSRGGSMYQPMWTSGPSPLEKLLEQQKQQRQHEPH